MAILPVVSTPLQATSPGRTAAPGQKTHLRSCSQHMLSVWLKKTLIKILYRFGQATLLLVETSLNSMDFKPFVPREWSRF